MLQSYGINGYSNSYTCTYIFILLHVFTQDQNLLFFSKSYFDNRAVSVLFLSDHFPPYHITNNFSKANLLCNWEVWNVFIASFSIKVGFVFLEPENCHHISWDGTKESNAKYPRIDPNHNEKWSLQRKLNWPPSNWAWNLKLNVFNDHERLLFWIVKLIGQISGKIIHYIFLDVTTMFIFWLNKLYWPQAVWKFVFVSWLTNQWRVVKYECGRYLENTLYFITWPNQVSVAKYWTRRSIWGSFCSMEEKTLRKSQ